MLVLVEVIEVVRGCTSIGSLSFPLNSAFRAIYSFVQEQRHSASPCFSCTTLFTHSDTAEKYRRSSKLSEVYCISLKLVKSNPMTYHKPLYACSEGFAPELEMNANKVLWKPPSSLSITNRIVSSFSCLFDDYQTYSSKLSIHTIPWISGFFVTVFYTIFFLV